MGSGKGEELQLWSAGAYLHKVPRQDFVLWLTFGETGNTYRSG